MPNKTIFDIDRDIAAGWCISQDHYAPEDEGLWEVLLTLSNGYFGCRGNLELPSAYREPGVYLAGVYDKPDVSADSETLGLDLRNKAITPAYAVAPLWNLVELEIEGIPVDFLNASTTAFSRTLDMKRGLLFSTYELEDAEHRTTQLRFVSAVLLTDPHLYTMHCEVTAVDYEGQIALRFCCRQPENPRYIPRLKDYVSHTSYMGCHVESHDGPVVIGGRTEQTGTDIALASRTFSDDAHEKTIEQRQNGVAERFVFRAHKNKPCRFTRLCAIAHSESHETPAQFVLDKIRETSGPPRQGNHSPCKTDCQIRPAADSLRTGTSGTQFASALAAIPEDSHLDRHIAAWADKWQHGNFEFEGDDQLLRGVRWNLFSLHQLGHFHSPAYSVSATGLHGQGYFGHVFWDTDIYMLPFYTLTSPDTAKDLLRYRYERLDAARTVAREHGFKGAKFPWTSTRDGRDVCPPDWERCGKRQIHISGDIAYAFHNYRRWTEDYEFFAECGVEVIVETARFFRSRMTEGDDGRLHILDVIGPDEYNIHADDNYYTNFLAQWNLRQAVAAMDELNQRKPDAFRALVKRIAWSEAERRELERAAARLAFPRVRDGVLEQYAGFFDLKDIGEIERDSNNMPVERLHAYDKGYQILKQADAVMALFLFPDAFPPDQQKKTFEYYEKRNTHASSLSASVSCIVGLRLGLREHAYNYFRLTSLLDVEDLHFDKNTHEGIHAACAGGACLSAFLGYGGIGLRNDELQLNPTLPEQWKSMHLSFQFRGQKMAVTVDSTGTKIHQED